jgi:hypothetical protein
MWPAGRVVWRFRSPHQSHRGQTPSSRPRSWLLLLPRLGGNQGTGDVAAGRAFIRDQSWYGN